MTQLFQEQKAVNSRRDHSLTYNERYMINDVCRTWTFKDGEFLPDLQDVEVDANVYLAGDNC